MSTYNYNYTYEYTYNYMSTCLIAFNLKQYFVLKLIKKQLLINDGDAFKPNSSSSMYQNRYQRMRQIIISHKFNFKFCLRLW